MKKTSQNDNAPRKKIISNPIKKKSDKGLIMIYTGDGKGKTSASFGMVLRALQNQWRVGVVQFIKGPWLSGEIHFLKSHSTCDIFTMGEGFTWDTNSFEQDCQTTRKTWKKCEELVHSKKYQLLVFDEIICCLDYAFLNEQTVINTLTFCRDQHIHVVLTGRNASQNLIQFSDLVTNMTCIKHPFDKGIMAQKGIDY